VTRSALLALAAVAVLALSSCGGKSMQVPKDVQVGGTGLYLETVRHQDVEVDHYRPPLSWNVSPLSPFRQITTSLERLLALIRPVPPGARLYRRHDASPRAASFRRRDRLCDGRVDVRGAHVISARASSVKARPARNKLDLRAVVAVCWDCDGDPVAGACQSLPLVGGQWAALGPHQPPPVEE
jgi:hypothetical protein